MSELLPTPSSRDWKGARRKLINGENISKTTGTSFGLDINQSVESLQYSPEDSRAKNFPMQENEKEQQELDTSGQKCYRLYTKSNPTSSLQKMLEALLVGNRGWHSKQCVLTWKSVVTPYNRLLFQLSPSVRRTGGIESGLLPTSGAQDWKKRGPNSKQQGLGEAVFNLLLTPTASESEMDLVKFKKRMEKYPNGTTMPNLSTQMSSGVGTGVKLRLQPAMTEWMMGYPEGWTELPYVESEPTPSQPVNTAKSD